MEQKKIRLLRPDEIECRIGTISEKGLSLLLFMDARAAQNILDESFTSFGWRRTHQEIGGRLYCTVEVWDGEKKQWINKQDVGTESFAEKEKGAASDSFKRACFNWGIGRELYSAPFIWIPADRVSIQYDGKRYTTPERFTVADISYNENREICGLEIRNGANRPVFVKRVIGEHVPAANGETKQEVKEQEPASAAPKSNGADPAETVKKQLTAKMKRDMQKELDRTGVPLEKVLERYHLTDITQMTAEQYRDAMTGLKRSQSRTAA